MDEDQRKALSLAEEGHNFIITGQAGCGKTYTCTNIIKNLRALGKTVSVCCSTGIAATHYGCLHASTLHKWSGIEDGRHLNEEILHLISTDERFSAAKKNITGTDALIIDEISMISAKTFSQVEFLCRRLRTVGNGTYFGGLQVILVGDFYQLPPVSNQLYGDSGRYCFLVPFFKRAFPHIVTLHIIHRQDNVNLINCVNELETGTLSDESTAFLHSLSRPLPINQNNQEPVQLFARNLDVDLFNYDRVQSMPGNLKLYNSKDEGSKHYLDKFLAPKHLGLKKMCPVMLLKNMDDTLVNGLRGIITNMFEDSVDVTFKIGLRTFTSHLKPSTFTTYDPVDKITLAKRTQIPLKVAFAITIHKSQGMSLDSVIINCKNCNQPGQLGVAVGRATSVEGLQVLQFRKSLCKSHPNSVTSFYRNASVGYIDRGLSCCRHNNWSLTEDDDDKNDDAGDDDDGQDGVCNQDVGCDDDFNSMITSLEMDSDFSENEIDYLTTMDRFDRCVPEINLILQKISQEFKDTPIEDQIHHFCTCIEEDCTFFNDWFKQVKNCVSRIFSEHFPDGKEKQNPKSIGKFYTAFQKYLACVEYSTLTTKLLQDYGFTEKGPEYQFLTSIMFDIQQQSFTTLGSQLKCETTNIHERQISDTLSASARGKIRYIGGYTIAKLKYQMSLRVRNTLFARGKEEELQQMQSKLHLLNSLCICYSDLEELTTDPDSLEEIRRKQNDRESLTNITDEAYEFFSKLEQKCRRELTVANLNEHGKYLHSYIQNELKNNCEIFKSWLTCIPSTSNIDETWTKSKSSVTQDEEEIQSILSEVVCHCENNVEIFNSIVNLFLCVSLSQFRKLYLGNVRKEKGKALRKKVMEKTKKATKQFNLKFCMEDKSEGKIVTHLRLKSELVNNPKFLMEKSFTKKDLQTFSEAYGLNLPSKLKKDDMCTKLTKTIVERESITKPSVFTDLSRGNVITPSEQAEIVDELQEVQMAVDQQDFNETPPEVSTDNTRNLNQVQRQGHDYLDIPCEQPGPSGLSLNERDVVDKQKEPRRSCRKPSTRRQTRSSVYKGKGKGKGKSRKISSYESDDGENCVVCNGVDIGGDDWISCDLCKLWYHRKCTNITDNEWDLLSSEESSPFVCPLCQ